MADASAACASASALTRPSEMASWYPGLLTAILSFQDLQSLVKCERVSKEWRAAVTDRSLWKALYCSVWRRSATLPPGIKLESAVDWKTICKQRCVIPLEPSTRAKWWIHPGQTLHVHNQGLQRAISRMCVESIRTAHALQPLLLSCPRSSETNTPRRSRRCYDSGVCYFEAHVRGCGSVGLASISTHAERQFYGFGSSYHVGWLPVSYGYYNDDGHFYWNDGPTRYDGHQLPYGPRWGERRPMVSPTPITTIGCGVELETGRLFFTKDGNFLGLAPRSVVLTRDYAAAVSLHHLGDMVELNLGRGAFAFDIEAYIAARSTVREVSAIGG